MPTASSCVSWATRSGLAANWPSSEVSTAVGSVPAFASSEARTTSVVVVSVAPRSVRTMVLVGAAWSELTSMSSTDVVSAEVAHAPAVTAVTTNTAMTLR